MKPTPAIRITAARTATQSGSVALSARSGNHTMPQRSGTAYGVHEHAVVNLRYGLQRQLWELHPSSSTKEKPERRPVL
eukprot:7106470-Pyramimonas_sp.AAC.1